MKVCACDIERNMPPSSMYLSCHLFDQPIECLHVFSTKTKENFTSNAFILRQHFFYCLSSFFFVNCDQIFFQFGRKHINSNYRTTVNVIIMVHPKCVLGYLLLLGAVQSVNEESSPIRMNLNINLYIITTHRLIAAWGWGGVINLTLLSPCMESFSLLH